MGPEPKESLMSVVRLVFAAVMSFDQQENIPLSQFPPVLKSCNACR